MLRTNWTYPLFLPLISLGQLLTYALEMRMRSKLIKSRATLCRLARHLREAGKEIVFTNGCYDLLHVGHLRCLQSARDQGDCLIVGINSDRSARRYKGRGHPIVPEAERAELLAALSCVDKVFIFDDPTVDRLLEEVRPHVYCKGKEYTLRTLPERNTVKTLGVRFRRVGDPKNHSSTQIVKTITALHGSNRKRVGRGKKRS